MELPTTIPLSAISLGERGRQDYQNIESLAESIEQNGLIQPLVLDSNFNLIAGGRRYHALLTLGVETLYHGTTSEKDPLRPGFILASEADPLTHTLREIAENLDRENLDWRDELRLILKAYHLARTSDLVNGILHTQRHYGVSLCGPGHYADLAGALAVHEDLVLNPQRYIDATSIQAAYKILLKVNANAISKLAHESSLVELPQLFSEEAPSPSPLPAVPGAFPQERLPIADPEHNQKVAVVGPEVERPTIPLSKFFFNTNGLDFMETCAPETFDHVITDPDYGVSVERLQAARVSNNADGIIQSSVEESLADLYRLIPLAYKVTKPHSFFVFFYDLDHHEKLQAACVAAGWAVQRWPLTWRKLDFRSNAAPSHNFCKNQEWAMVCRKPGAVLAQVQLSSVFDTMTGKVTKELGHTFAKPYPLWKWIFAAVSIRGQIVFDPFCGSGSSAIAALQWGLRPVGCELNPDHFNNLMCNLQIAYVKQLGKEVKFT